MKVNVRNKTDNFNSYRAARVKSLFNAERGDEFNLDIDVPVEGDDWKIGVIVGPSGSGKTSIGKQLFGGGKIADLYKGWSKDIPIVDDISPDGDFNTVTGLLASVGLGDVPSWLRPFHALSNGQQFRAGLARIISDGDSQTVVDEFTSVVDRQIAKIGALAFSKAFRRTKDRQIILLSCHYDILEWVQPDWVLDTASGEVKKKNDIGERPRIKLDVWKVDRSYWKYFKEHYYLDLNFPPAAEYFIGTVDGELVSHLAVCPMFTAGAYRATRLVVMPEWQGAGVGTKFLELVMEYHKQGNGRKGHKLPTIFHTSHPQLIGFLNRSKKWILKSQVLFGGNKKQSQKSIVGASIKRGEKGISGGFGGHFRAVQGFKYIGDKNE